MLTDASGKRKKEDDKKVEKEEDSKSSKKKSKKPKKDDKEEAEETKEEPAEAEEDSEEDEDEEEKEEEMDAEKKKECTIFVGNVPVTVTKKELRRIFAPYGKIQSIRFRSVAFAFPKRKNGDKKVRLRWCVCVCGGACAVVRVRA